MHRSLRILCSAVLVAGGLAVAAPADAAATPSSKLVAVTKKITADTAPKFGVAFAHLPSGSTSYLQRQYGTKRVWKNVVKVAQKKQTITAPKAPMGKLGYRLITVRKGKTVAVSKGVVVYSYGTTSFRAVCQAADGQADCDSDTNSVQVGDRLFSYNVVVDTGYYPDYYVSVSMPRTSCRSFSLDFASRDQDAVEHLRLVQASSDPQYAQVANGSVGSVRFALDGGPFQFGASADGGGNFSYVALNGRASCWTSSGKR